VDTGRKGDYMILDNGNMFKNTGIYASALDAAWKRNQLISNNIANDDTPGYKRKDIDFKQYMQSALDEANQTTSARRYGPEASIYEDNSNLSYRLDGNNVDMDTEMVYLAENQIKYNTILRQINYEFQRLKAVLK